MLRNKVSFRCALLACVASTIISGPALAQDAQAPVPQSANDDTPRQDIVVTGSRVRGAAPVGSSVISVGRDEINASGAVTIDRVIREIPQVFDLGISENSRGQAGGNSNVVYGNSVNLRGIGPYATLVLIDGHRAVSNTRFVDPSILPSLGVERIEVVADGASAIYGSDAVAGVVNIIPRRTLDGGEAMARYGISSDGVFHEYQAGIALGKVWSTGQAMVAYEHVFRSNLLGDDRNFFRSDLTEFGGRDYRVTRCDPGTIRAGTTTYAIPAAGVTQAGAASLVPGTTNRCNDLIGQDLFPQQRYDSLNGTFTQELTDWLTVFGDGFYSKRHFRRDPGHSSATLNVPQTNAFFVRPAGFTGTSYQLDYNFYRDLPRNTVIGSSENWQVTPGLRVKLPADWSFEAILSVGRTNDQSNQRNGVNNAALNAALASSNPATAFDPYGLGRTNQAVLDAISNQVFLAPTLARFTGYEARLNGTLFSLPGGDVKLAAGYEGQQIRVDLGSARGGPTTPITYRRFSRRVDSGYGELLVPIFGTENAIPGFYKLELNAAVRYDRYDDVGDTTNPKFGVNWSPVRGLTLRGSYGTSFRAPLISQIYGNSNNLFVQSYQNPTGGAPITGVAYSGPNLNLGPEKAKTWSVGADFDGIEGLRLGITYFNVDYKSQVEAYLSDLAILAREPQFEGTGIILRGTQARDRVLELLSQGVALAGGSFPGGSANNVTLYVDGRNNNLGRSITRGIDFTANYRHETSNAGTFFLSANGTYLTDYKVSITPTGTAIDRRNTIFQPLKFKARASVAWQIDPMRVQLQATHVGGYLNNAITPNERVKSYTPVDLILAFNVGERKPERFMDGGFTFGIDVRNLFNIRPPFVNLAPGANGSGGYDASASNPVGRLISVSVRKSW